MRLWGLVFRKVLELTVLRAVREKGIGRRTGSTCTGEGGPLGQER